VGGCGRGSASECQARRLSPKLSQHATRPPIEQHPVGGTMCNEQHVANVRQQQCSNAHIRIVTHLRRPHVFILCFLLKNLFLKM
jgi:hypothetical protein